MAWYERDFSDTFGTELQPLGSGVVGSNLFYSPTCEQSLNWVQKEFQAVNWDILGSMVDTWV